MSTGLKPAGSNTLPATFPWAFGTTLCLAAAPHHGGTVFSYSLNRDGGQRAVLRHYDRESADFITEEHDVLDLQLADPKVPTALPVSVPAPPAPAPAPAAAAPAPSPSPSPAPTPGAAGSGTGS